MLFTQTVKDRLVAQAEQQARDAQAAITFAKNLPVGKSTDIAREVRISLTSLNGIQEVQPKRRGRRHLSAAVKANISKKMKARWAKRRKENKESKA